MCQDVGVTAVQPGVEGEAHLHTVRLVDRGVDCSHSSERMPTYYQLFKVKCNAFRESDSLHKAGLTDFIDEASDLSDSLIKLALSEL